MSMSLTDRWERASLVIARVRERRGVGTSFEVGISFERGVGSPAPGGVVEEIGRTR
ncbi:hypothetical protein ACSDR0_22425 [Streptosporangium sp. G11]|uniref:hypothetical protein n=1 Tax=Streptosporangium sp. G11 TaxID=3436926 RepID=UPI003EBAD37F